MRRGSLPLTILQKMQEAILLYIHLCWRPGCGMIRVGERGRCLAAVDERGGLTSVFIRGSWGATVTGWGWGDAPPCGGGVC